MMIYREESRDLFMMPEDYYLAHCISADFALGKGIAVEFNKRFDMKHKLLAKYPNFTASWKGGDCILEDRVFNLVTKERYWQKPTYDSIERAITAMMLICCENNIEKIAMPAIGCGLDRLEWCKVSRLIKDIFLDTNIEIVVCKK